MKEKKYIDRLYQEKFKDFEATPREEVWKSISSRLQENRRQRTILPLWYRIAGVAAVFTLLLMVGEWFSPNSSPAIVNDTEVLELDQKEIIPFDNTPVLANSEENEDLRKQQNPIAQATNIGKEIPAEKSGIEEKTSKASHLDASGIKASAQQNWRNLKIPSPNEEKATSLIFVKKKSILDDISQIDDEEHLKNTISNNNLEISTFAAPVFYGNLGEGSFLDPQFNENSSENEITYSYGIQLAYAITEDLKIRSGLNMVSMNYNTKGIEYHAAIRPQAISSVAYDQEQFYNLSTSNKSNYSSKRISGTYRASVGSIHGAFLNQKLGYLEVPVELEYKIVDKKVEVNLIGGASTLFLNENTVSVNTGNFSTKLGKANNLNEVSFSTNLGLGLDYNITDKFKLNLEPMFKYQLNTFNSETNINYQPFYLAVYSGFSFEF